MNPERWREIDELLSAVLERETSERPAFLARECHGDEELRREVESLLEAHDEADGFLDSQGFETIPDEAVQPTVDSSHESPGPPPLAP